jgi:hypothetical protein
MRPFSIGGRWAQKWTNRVPGLTDVPGTRQSAAMLASRGPRSVPPSLTSTRDSAAMLASRGLRIVPSGPYRFQDVSQVQTVTDLQLEETFP